MELIMNLTERDFNDIEDVLNQYDLDFINVNWAISLFDDDLIGKIIFWGASDTEVRSQIVNSISKKLVKKSWPTYKDYNKINMDKFIMSIRTAYNKLNI